MADLNRVIKWAALAVFLLAGGVAVHLLTRKYDVPVARP